jgi:hypothetical protein
MVGTALMLYSMRNSARWLRHVTDGIDQEIAGLCRQHWQKARVAAGGQAARPSRPGLLRQSAYKPCAEC